MNNFIQKISSKKVLPFIIAGSVLCYSFVFYFVSQIGKLSGGKGVLDFEFGYSTSSVSELFNSYGIEGVDLYINMLTVDIFNPLMYTLLLMAIMYILLKETKYYKMAFIPVFVGLFDYLENIFLYKMASNFPQLDDSTIAMGNALSITKRVVMIIAILCLISAIFIWLKNRKIKS